MRIGFADDELDGHAVQERRVAALRSKVASDVENQTIGSTSDSTASHVWNASVSVGQPLGELLLIPKQGDAHASGRHTSLHVENVARQGRHTVTS